MKIAVLDLSRNTRPFDKDLHPIFGSAMLERMDKGAWKRLGPAALLRATRTINADRFVIAVDDLATAQDLALLKLLGVMSSARRFAILEMSTGQLHDISGARVWLVEFPRFAIDAILAAFFVLLFVAFVFSLLALAWCKRTSILAGYRRQRQSLRVAYLKSDLALNITAGGSIAHTRGVIGGFLSNSAEIRIVSNERVDWLQFDGVQCDVVERTKLFNVLREIERMVNGIWFAWAARNRIRDYAPNVIYQRKCLLDLSGVLLSLWLRVPLVIEGNDSVVQGLYWERARLKWVAALVERLQFAACAKAVCISQPLWETFAQLKYDTRKLLVVFNGVDVERFDTAAANNEAKQVRADMGVGNDSLLVGFVGTFGQWHGIGLLTRAISAMARTRNDLRWVLVGDGELRLSCERELREAGDLEGVCFAGLVPARRVPAYLAACDILVSPHSRSPDGRKFFGSPTKLFEYMAAHRAIVASNLDQLGVVLSHENSALLFEPDSLPEFTSALHRVCDDSDLRRKLGAEARRVVSNKYTWHANVSTVIAALQ